MPRHVHKPQQDKTTQVTLENIREVREETRKIKADLLEHNSLIKLHGEEGRSEMAPSSSDREVQELTSVERRLREEASLREPQHSEISFKEEAANYLTPAFPPLMAQWAAFPFQVIDIYFRNWDALLSAQPSKRAA